MEWAMLAIAFGDWKSKREKATKRIVRTQTYKWISIGLFCCASLKCYFIHVNEEDEVMPCLPQNPEQERTHQMSIRWALSTRLLYMVVGNNTIENIEMSLSQQLLIVSKSLEMEVVQ